MNQTVEFILRHRIVVIYRGLSPELCLEISQILKDCGLRLFEVTLNSRHALETIRMLRSRLGDEAMVGAGTVKTIGEVEQAADAGASFIISPNVKMDVIERTKKMGLVSIPGAFTASEIQAASEAGADIVKLFPINVVGAEYIRQIKAPLDDIKLMPSGGITVDSAAELFKAGADAIGIGMPCFGTKVVENKDWDTLRAKANAFMAAAGLQ